MCEVGGDQIADCTQLPKCLGSASGDPSKLMALQEDCHQENSSLFQEVAAACPGQNATAKNSLASGWQPAVHLSAHIGIRRVAGAWYPQCCLCLCWPLGVFHLSGQGWTAKAVTPARLGFVCPRAPAGEWLKTQIGVALTIKTAQCTLSTCGGGEVLPPGSHPPPSAAFGANPGFPGDTKQVSPVSPRSSYKELMTSVSRQCAHGQSITCSALALIFHYYFMFGYQGGEAGLNYVTQLTSSNLASVS